jgi:hypothetical protein
VVEDVEYVGREYETVALAPGNLLLYFRTPLRLRVGEAVRLGAAPGRVLVYRPEGDAA